MALELVLLLGQAIRQRLKLTIGRRRLACRRINGKDRLHEVLRKRARHEPTGDGDGEQKSKKHVNVTD